MVKITEKDIVNFEKDGVIKIEDAISLNQLEELDRALISQYLARRKLITKLIFGDSLYLAKTNVWKTDTFFLQFVQQQMFIDLAVKLLKSSRINLLQDIVFVKSANSRQKFIWHHDQIYAPIHGKKVVSFWMATENVTLHNGGLQFIKGSHRWTENISTPPLTPMSKLLPQYWLRRKPSNLSSKTVEDSDSYSKDDVVSFDLKPGDLLAFQGKAKHRSGPNWSDKIDRKGYVVRYTGDDVKYNPHPDTGVAYQFWKSKLNAGEKMKGPLFPLLYENSQYLKIESDGPGKGSVWNILHNKILALQSKPIVN